MANHFRLYGRPLMADEVLPPLTITGSLPFFVPGEPYEGRLQINNSIGRCTVEVIEAGLPPGYSVRVDNVTKEVVVKWDAYEEVEDEISAVPNGDFEQGDNGQWALGNGWSIKSGGAETGTFSAVFENFRGNSSIESVRVPYTPGTPIRAQCRFQQGASSKGNLAGRAILIWCDAKGNMLPGGEGKSFSVGTLINSGSGGEWQTSEVTGASREAATVAVGFSANRKKQNKLARVDNFTWNHKYTLGTDKREDYFLSIKVTDSANRVAYWSGSLLYKSILAKSQRYPVTAYDSMAITPLFVGASTKDSLLGTDAGYDGLGIIPLFISASTKSLYWAHTQPPEDFLGITPLFVSASTKQVQIIHSQPAEDYLSVSPLFVGASTKKVLLTNTLETEAITITPLFIGASTSG